MNLVYMNKKTLDAYGFTSVEEIKGKPCYEILQKSSIPCGMCNNDKLCVGAFEEWRDHSAVVDKYMLLKNTLITDAENAGFIACSNGWKWAYLEQGMIAAIQRSMQACLILAILGAIISSWMAAGTIPTMMYYGIKIINPKIFEPLVCCAASYPLRPVLHGPLQAPWV